VAPIPGIISIIPTMTAKKAMEKVLLKLRKPRKLKLSGIKLRVVVL